MYECGYCGALAEATNDHIPPKNLFDGPLAGPLPTVKACATCNGGASLDDEYLRDTIMLYHRTADLPKTQGHIEKMLRAVALPAKAAYARSTLARFGSAEAQTPAGVYLGRLPVVNVEGGRLERGIARYARGLHRYHYEERVPADTPMRIVVNPDGLHQYSEEFIKGFRGATVHTIQEGVFWYARLRPAARPLSSYWLMMFFDVFPTIVAIRPDEPLPRSARVAV